MSDTLPFQKTSDRVKQFHCTSMDRLRAAFQEAAERHGEGYFLIRRNLWNTRFSEIETITWASYDSAEEMLQEHGWMNETAMRPNAAGILFAPLDAEKVMNLKGDFDQQFNMSLAEGLAQLPADVQTGMAEIKTKVDAVRVQHEWLCQPLLKKLTTRRPPRG